MKDPTEYRREFHQYPESGWKEFRTTAVVAETLDDLGYDLYFNGEAMDVDARLGMPPEEEVDAAIERSLEQGAPEGYVTRMDGVTGLVAEQQFGESEKPVVGIRVDIDALELTEADDDTHIPAHEGFASKNEGTMHACGHDGHAAIGLGVADKLTKAADAFSGTVRLFFQPAEEGGRGGKPMSETAHVADLDLFISPHIGLGHEVGTVIAAYDHPKATTKFDIEFRGESSHAGSSPHQGRNAVQSAANAIQNLYAIPRHGSGMTRINVGDLHSNNARNVIADRVSIGTEVRGDTDELNEYMEDHLERIVSGSAAAYDTEVSVTVYGQMPTFESDPEAISIVMSAADRIDAVDNLVKRERMGASEDVAHFVRAVQRAGGAATFIGIGGGNEAGHHTPRFDIDERSIPIGIDVITKSIYEFHDGYNRWESQTS